MTPGQQAQVINVGQHATLKVIGYRVMNAITGERLHKACFSKTLAEERAEKHIKKGVPAIVERTDGQAA